jgi:putative cardiolipin synthase
VPPAAAARSARTCGRSGCGGHTKAQGFIPEQHHHNQGDAVSTTEVVPLRRPLDALVARLALIDAAEVRLDLQYYLWDSDAVGYLLLDRLIAAADRGVPVRLLVDDLKLRRRTHSIASLCCHPNIEIRVFNPWRRRSSAAAQGLEFIRRFSTLDHRMHNKLLIADDRKAIFGGRNIAGEHFGLGEKFNLVDDDLLLVGPEVAGLSSAFETYWESPVSISGIALSKPVGDEDLSATRGLVARELQKRQPTVSTVLAEQDGWTHKAASMAVSLEADALEIVADAPSFSRGASPTQVIETLHRAINRAEQELVAITPFFVPDEIDVDWYRTLIDRGIRIRILTNSLASNMGTISNSGLKKKRFAMVQAGVELYELRTDASVKPDWEIPPQVARYLGLHAKLYAIDRARLFVGSVNIDPRSKRVNTEVAALIHSPELSEHTADAIESFMTPRNAWKVEIGPDDRLRWHSDAGTLQRQPARNGGQRLADAVLGLLPIHPYI